MKDEVALLASVTLLGVLLQGDLGAQGLPRFAAAHHWPAGVRAHLPSPSELQRVLPAVPRHALGGRHLLSRRCGSTVWSGLPVRTPTLLPGLRALCAAEAGPAVRERARALASRGPGGPWPARPLPPGRAARRAPWTAPETAAEVLRRRTPGRRICS
ncbi:leukotriene C4 synthase isoform X3 [Bos taurus]|uniref:leukotriene C4 synthase isoform X3 n=1 Tax=Bos taurus TaxID=9913 RepID=UPI0003840B1A|nr:leukotriene C4 synthase isoform X3 [Bos taurus]